MDKDGELEEGDDCLKGFEEFLINLKSIDTILNSLKILVLTHGGNELFILFIGDKRSRMWVG